jgi:hypothetical protein
MGLTKVGLSLGKEILGWTRTSGKCLLATKPVKINTAVLKYAPKLEHDVGNFSQRWTKNATEYFPDCKIPNSQIPSHHAVEGYNTDIRCMDYLSNDDEYLADNLFGAYKAVKTDKEFAKLAPLEKDCIGYRQIGRYKYDKKTLCVPAKILEEAKIGDVIKPDKGCAYAFQDKFSIDRYFCSGPDKIREIIRLPKGAKVSRNMEHYGEFLMPRSAEYKLVSKNIDYDGTAEYVLEYIMPKTKYPDDTAQIKAFAERYINSTDSYIKKLAQKILDEIKEM